MSSLLLMGAGSVAEVPGLPNFTDVAACYGVNNFNWSDYGAGAAVNYENGDTDNFDVVFESGTPYALEWGALNPPLPYLVNTWWDQSANVNSLIQIGSKRPTLNSTDKVLSFAGGGVGALQSSGNLYSKVLAGTVYVLFKAADLIGTQVICETDNWMGFQKPAEQLSLRVRDGEFAASFSNELSELNTKAKVLSDFDWHLMTVTFDTSLAAANQVQLKVDNSSDGVTAPDSQDLSGVSQIGRGILNVGASNNGERNFFVGGMRLIQAKTVVDDEAAQSAMWGYVHYLQSLLP